MVHARPDYNRMQDPALADPALLSPGSTPIAEDEPVCLFRAQDKHFLSVLRSYERDVLSDISDATTDDERASGRAVVMSVREHVIRARQWQIDHGCKSPDL